MKRIAYTCCKHDSITVLTASISPIVIVRMIYKQLFYGCSDIHFLKKMTLLYYC